MWTAFGFLSWVVVLKIPEWCGYKQDSDIFVVSKLLNMAYKNLDLTILHYTIIKTHISHELRGDKYSDLL